MNHSTKEKGERRQAQSTKFPQPDSRLRIRTTPAERIVLVTLARLGYIVTSTDRYTRLIRKAAV